MNIRVAKEKDAPALSALLAQLGYPSTDASNREKIKAYSKTGYKMLVAEADKTIVGFISLHHYVTPHLPGPTGRITAFCMDEKSRGRGLGTLLLAAGEQYFKEMGCYKIEVTSNLKRTRTHAYYLNLGYQQTSMHFAKFLKDD